jgi:hypothetical protein
LTAIACESATTISEFQGAVEMMAGIGEAASVIAVIDLAAKTASLCFQYSRDVAGAKKEITELQTELFDLQNVLEKVKRLLDQPDSAKLLAFSESKHAFDNCKDELKELNRRLNVSTTRKSLSRLGLRALKWPLESKEVEKAVNHLERYKNTISLVLQTDQT